MIAYQLSGNLSALNLLLLLRLPPLPDLVLQLLAVHGLLLPVRGVPDVVVDRLPDALVALEPESKVLIFQHWRAAVTLFPGCRRLPS